LANTFAFLFLFLSSNNTFFGYADIGLLLNHQTMAKFLTSILLFLCLITTCFSQKKMVLGDKDVLQPEVGIKMNRAIKNSQWCILPNTPHIMSVEKPVFITKLVIDFLNIQQYKWPKK